MTAVVSTLRSPPAAEDYTAAGPPSGLSGPRRRRCRPSPHPHGKAHGRGPQTRLILILYLDRGLRYTDRVTRALAMVLAVAVLLTSIPLPAAAQTTEADVYVALCIIELDVKNYAAATWKLLRAPKIVLLYA